MRTWIIGSGSGCDVVVAQPRVSGRHCRFTEFPDGHLVEDMGSLNGTYVNGERIAGPTRVSPADRITLGALVPMPWPPTLGVPGATVFRIGRAADNDIVLGDPRVSSYHARLIVSVAGTLIEDLGSANGTYLNSPESQATQAVSLSGADTVYFGSFAVPAASLLQALPGRWEPDSLAPPLPEPTATARPATAAPPPLVVPRPMAINPWSILVLAQSPVLAILIVLAFGRQAAVPITPTSWHSVADAIAWTTFALALSAIWLGGSLACWPLLVRRPHPEGSAAIEEKILASPWPGRVVLGVLCFAQCAALLAIVHWGSGLSGPWLPMFGVLLLTASVALMLGLLAFSIIRAPRGAAAVLVFAFVAMTILGGKLGSLAASRPGAWIAAGVPSRWAFEGLLLLESERLSPTAGPKRTGSEPAIDPAEAYFPADSERMGPRADAMALGCILIGLTATATLVSARGRSAR